MNKMKTDLDKYYTLNDKAIILPKMTALVLAA